MPIEKIIVALDFASKKEVEAFLGKFSENKPSFVKVGMELFYAEGPEIIKYLKDQGLKVFLDLKVHDIPNTAAGALSSLAKYGVDILNVHAGGGIEMMRRAKAALSEASPETKLIAVTQLTSIDQATMNGELDIQGSIEDAVLRLAGNAKQAGLDGVVCSPLEAKIIKKFGKDFLAVCPGVRLSSGDTHDQKRITTPHEAFKNGADYIVMGRAITQAENPEEVLMKLS